jgi:carbonic anhydrase
MPKSFKSLLEGNQHFVQTTNLHAPDFFEKLSKEQHPEFLWIGCADSRVPANEVTNSLPGSIFVQRNIANMVIHTDYNLLSVVNYAVKALKVKHIIICGHYGCGGVKAAMSNDSYGLLDGWLAHIKDVYRIHKDELNGIEDENARADRFVELNVQEQVYNMAKVSFIQENWKNGEFPYIHGWVYDLKSGMLKDLGYTVNSSKSLDKVYQY